MKDALIITGAIVWMLAAALVAFLILAALWQAIKAAVFTARAVRKFGFEPSHNRVTATLGLFRYSFVNSPKWLRGKEGGVVFWPGYSYADFEDEIERVPG